MGYGNYSYEAHQRLTRARSHQSRQEVFRQRSVHPLMNPYAVVARESRDSPGHPNSVPIVFALDVTGSMGRIPDLLARQELPHFMKALLEAGVSDPQVLFMFVGDFACDTATLQVGQFESAAEDMDRWLTWGWLEGGGGGNSCESYELAMYFAARHTVTDSVLKRKRRGYFFMSGDENPYPVAARACLKSVLGDEPPADLPVEQVCQELAGLYHPFFLIPAPDRRGQCEKAWRRLLGDHVVCLERYDDTCFVASALVALGEGVLADLDELAQRLERGGLERRRVGGIVRALTPFASTLGRDGAAQPHLDKVVFP